MLTDSADLQVGFQDTVFLHESVVGALTVVLVPVSALLVFSDFALGVASVPRGNYFVLKTYG